MIPVNGVRTSMIGTCPSLVYDTFATPSEPSFLLCYTLYELLLRTALLFFLLPCILTGGATSERKLPDKTTFFSCPKIYMFVCMLPFYYLPPSERDKSHPKGGLLQQQTKQLQKKATNHKVVGSHHSFIMHYW